MKSPTASFVQAVYVHILQDLGFNTGSMLVPSMELLDSLDHQEVTKMDNPVDHSALLLLVAVTLVVDLGVYNGQFTVLI